MPDAVQDRDISERGGVSPPVLGRKPSSEDFPVLLLLPVSFCLKFFVLDKEGGRKRPAER